MKLCLKSSQAGSKTSFKFRGRTVSVQRRERDYAHVYLGGVTFPPHLDPSTSLVVVPIDLLQVRSQVDIDDYFESYQYDVVSNTRGHVGILAGVAYFHAKGVLQTPPIVTQLHSLVIRLTTTEERSVPLPLIGGEFRYFLPPTTQLLKYKW